MMNVISRIIKNILFALRNSNDDKSFSEGMYLDKPKDSEYQADTVNVEKITSTDVIKLKIWEKHVICQCWHNVG